MENHPHWTSDTPVDTGWYWYRDQLHPEHNVVDSHGEFDGTPAARLVGVWWSAQIKAFV